MIASSITIVLLMVMCGWALICNGRTLKQRLKIVNAIGAYCRQAIGTDEFAERYQLFDQLNDRNYLMHGLMLMTFRDPMQVYPESIRQLTIK